MNIFCEFQLDRIRVKIHGDEIAFQVNPDFYKNKMFRDSLTSTRIRGYVQFNKGDLTFFERIVYLFRHNRVYILVNKEVQEFVTMRQIHDYATKFMDGRAVFVIPKPDSFDSTVLEDARKIRTEYIHSRHGDTAVSHLKTVATGPSAVLK